LTDFTLLSRRKPTLAVKPDTVRKPRASTEIASGATDGASLPGIQIPS
jgi:hypothetical protein